MAEPRVTGTTVTRCAAVAGGVGSARGARRLWRTLRSRSLAWTTKATTATTIVAAKKTAIPAAATSTAMSGMADLQGFRRKNAFSHAFSPGPEATASALRNP